MEVKAKLNNLRIAPRKVRLAANLIKGLDASEAKTQLRFLVKKSSRPLAKLLDSAIANAKNNFDLEEKNLYVSKILVDGGPVLKRWLPRAFGRATPIMKRTSHITLILAEKIPKLTKAKRKTGEKKEVSRDILAPEIKEEKIAEEKPKQTKTRESKRPFGASGASKKRIFSRQGVKRMFQRKSV